MKVEYKVYTAILLLVGGAYATVSYMSYQNSASRDRSHTVSEAQWDEFSAKEGCSAVQSGTTWRTVEEDGATYTDQGRIVTYNCQGRSITTRRFP